MFSFLKKAFNLTTDLNLNYNDTLFNTVFSLSFWKRMIEKFVFIFYISIYKPQYVVDVGDTIANPLVCLYPNKQFIPLHDILKEDDKPIVFNISSYTCPVFRKSLVEFSQLYDQYKDQYNFCILYIKEAHPIEGWTSGIPLPLSGKSYKQPKTMKERFSIVDDLYNSSEFSCCKEKIPIIVDYISDNSNEVFMSEPVRLYVIDPNGKVLFKGGRGPLNYGFDRFKKFITSSTVYPKIKRMDSIVEDTGVCQYGGGCTN